MLNKKNIKKLLDDTESRQGQVFTWIIQSLIVLSIITFSLETLPDLTDENRGYLRLIEIVIVFIFTVEYVLRIYITEKKLTFIFSFYGIIDLIAIVPFYLMSGLDLRTVRLFRLFRLIRLLKLFKYSKALSRFKRAVIIAKEELVLFGFLASIMIYLAAVGIYFFENSAQPDQFSSIFHSLWWAVVTLTTVGYGDMYPITVGGKIFTVIMLTVGLGIVAVPTGLVASALSQARKEEADKRKNKSKKKFE